MDLGNAGTSGKSTQKEGNQLERNKIKKREEIKLKDYKKQNKGSGRNQIERL